MNHKTLCILMSLALGSLALACADSESRMPFADTATAVINLGHADAPDQPLSAIDIPRRDGRIPPPLQFSRVQVRVSGPDIGTIEKNFVYADTVLMDVPPGPFRRFEVTVYVAPYDVDNPFTWTAANSFRGISTANLPAGSTISVPVLMILNETKIVVPDRLNGRVVQFNRVADALQTWVTSEDAGYHGIPMFNPTDIDFDAQGRIFILSNNGGSDTNIYRIDNIHSTASLPCIYIPPMLNIVSIALDRRRNILYYATNDYAGIADLYMIDMNDPRWPSIDTTPVKLDNPIIPPMMQKLFFSIEGIDVGDDGMLYVVGLDNEAYPSLFKYNPLVDNGVEVGKHFTNSDWYNPMDVQVKGGDAYVLNLPGDYQGYVLLRFNFGFSPEIGAQTFKLAEHFGSLEMVGNSPEKGFFYGPKKFAVRREEGFVIIDEGAYSDPLWRRVDRLVFTDFSPLAPWYQYPAVSVINSPFQFYDLASC